MAGFSVTCLCGTRATTNLLSTSYRQKNNYKYVPHLWYRLSCELSKSWSQHHPTPLPNVGSCKIQKSQTCLKLVMAAKCSSTKQTFINKLFCWLCLAGRTPRLLGMSRFSYYWYAVPKHTHHWSSTLIINLHVYIHDIWINIHINIYFNTHINIHIDIYMNIYIHNILLITA